jgi:hypothetical protein
MYFISLYSSTMLAYLKTPLLHYFLNAMIIWVPNLTATTAYIYCFNHPAELGLPPSPFLFITYVLTTTIIILIKLDMVDNSLL